MNMMKCKKEIHVVCGILFILGTILIATTGPWGFSVWSD